MKTILAVAALSLAVLIPPPPAYAVGCLSGAVVGGAAGHVAGHHGFLGAVGGCAVGHHMAVSQRRQRLLQQQQMQQQQTTPSGFNSTSPAPTSPAGTTQ